tara:strand:- start:526 stop:1431 length:906 start_codon:yes stop_codon:yes gene_type:complete
MKKLAIQLSGQLRNWSRFKKIVLPYWERIVEFGKENNVEVHFHGAFWDEDHEGGEQKGFWGDTHYYSSHSDWDVFKNIKFVGTKKEILMDSKPLGQRRKDTYKGNKSPIASWPWGWCMYEASKGRRLWQEKNNHNYDIVIVTRPEIYLKKNNVKEIFNKIEECSKYDFTVFSHRINHNMTTDDNWENLPYSDDGIILGTEESINLYCTNIVFLFLDNKPKIWKDFAGHIAVPHIIKNLTLNHISPWPNTGYMLDFNLFRLNSDVAIVDPESEKIKESNSKKLEVAKLWDINLDDAEDFHLW